MWGAHWPHQGVNGLQPRRPVGWARPFGRGVAEQRQWCHLTRPLEQGAAAGARRGVVGGLPGLLGVQM